MSLAQDEADRLFNEKQPVRRHPEDERSSEDNDNYDSDDTGHDRKIKNTVYDNDSGNDGMVAKPAPYHVPSTTYAANTGPKGVIADAQAYERARKRSFRRTIMSATGLSRDAQHPSAGFNNYNNGLDANLTQPASDESEDERFMRQWREARMQELQQQPVKRRMSPGGKRKYGTVDAVDANGYLDAIEKSPPETVVVVCIYDPESAESSIVEDCLTTVARQHPTTRFIKLHYEVADMEHVEAPALLAYKDGDVFATIVKIFHQLPNGRDCSASSLADLLMQHRVF